jgi:hypothetical protein
MMKRMNFDDWVELAAVLVVVSVFLAVVLG